MKFLIELGTLVAAFLVAIGVLRQTSHAVVSATLTAGTTQTQAGGLALIGEVNEVGTVANTDDTVVLPTASQGRRVTIINNGANRLQVFPASGDNLGAGADTALAAGVAAGDTIVFVAYDATNWEIVPLVPAASAITREGGNTTEATTTSTTAVDVLTASSLTVAVGQPAFSTFAFRKTTGAADEIRLGLKLNSTEVRIPFNSTGVNNEVESGIGRFWLHHGVTNYLRAGALTTQSDNGPSQVGALSTADMPTVEVTSWVIRGRTDNALITLGIDELHVYNLAAN